SSAGPAGGVYRRIAAHRAGSIGERVDWLCGGAGAARDAADFWIGSSRFAADGGVWRSDRGGDCGHDRAYGGASRGIAGGGDDGVGGGSPFYLFVAQANGVNPVAHPAAMGAMRSPGEASRANNDVRLSVEQVSYAYSPNPTQAPLFTLEATSFQARAGEIVAILGPNASGKSTLLKLIAGTLEPLSGRVLLNGFVTHSLTARTRAQRIAMVQQESQLLFPARAWEFV